jgi:hypothetical protein
VARHAPSRELSRRVNDYPDDERIFGFEDGSLYIAHRAIKKMLKNGPKEPPGTCTGLYSLSLPNSQQGKFDNVSLILTAGAHLAKNTIFAN